MKISKISATRCQILRLKRTKFDFRWGFAPDPEGGAYSAPQTPSHVFKGLFLRGGREGKGTVERERKERGRERRGGEGAGGGSSPKILGGGGNAPISSFIIESIFSGLQNRKKYELPIGLHLKSIISIG